jgi:DNA-binding NarL/FixJ family response regulator/sugar-specific transcriptional regulator TrmB
MLQSFGVGQRTEEVYRAMLDLPRAGVEELAAHLGLGDEDVRTELDHLAGLTLVEPREGRALHYLALPPDQAVEVLIAREEERLLARQREVSATRTSIGELVDSFVASRSKVGDDGLVEQLDGFRVVRSRLYQLTASATRHAASMVPGEAFSQRATEASLRLDTSLLARGISLRTIVSEVSLATPHWDAYLRRTVALGAQVRAHPAPPMLAVLIDSSSAVIPQGTDLTAGAMVVHGAALTAPVAALFDEIWHDSTPLAAEPGELPGDPHLSEARIRQVVALLAQGQKDEAIARRMGVSVRTVRRLVSEAVDALHAQSRFQAGVLAAHRGWVPGPGSPDVPVG